MKKGVQALLEVLLLLFSSMGVSAYPGGGGGIEYFSNREAATFSRMGLPTSGLLDMPSGTVYGITGFGYGVARDGLKVGGFGTALFTNDMRLELPNRVDTVTRVIGGIGGLISGGQAKLGPVILSGNFRLGCGGLAVSTENDPSVGRLGITAGIVALYGSLDAEIGVKFLPAMMVSLFAGVNAFMPMSYDVAFTLLPVPVAGLRITWGHL